MQAGAPFEAVATAAPLAGDGTVAFAAAICSQGWSFRHVPTSRPGVPKPSVTHVTQRLTDPGRGCR